MTIPTLVNGMITMMLAKFMLNDLPHAAGLANPSRKLIPSTFGTVNRAQNAEDFLLPYLREESEDFELIVVDILRDDILDHYGPYATFMPGVDIAGHVQLDIRINPFPGEVVHSMSMLAHEIGHYRIKTAGVVVSARDEEAQAKSIGRHLLREWLGR